MGNNEPAHKKRKITLSQNVPAKSSRYLFDLPIEVLWHIWAFLRVESILTFACTSSTAYDAVCAHLHHLSSLLVVRQDLSGQSLLALVSKLHKIKLLSIVCGKISNGGFEFAATHNLTFQDVIKVLSTLPSKDALVDINGGNCHLGDMNNLRVLAETCPKMFARLANLHVSVGLSKEVMFDILSNASNLRALTLDHCIVDLRGPANNQGYTNVVFPCLSYLNLCGVSFVYSNSLARLLYGCGNSLVTFEMYGCIGYVDSELDHLVKQEHLQMFTLKQQCQLTPRFLSKFRCDNLKALSLDSVRSVAPLSKLIATASSVMSLELANVGNSNGIFEEVAQYGIKNTCLQQLVLCNCILPEPNAPPMSGAELSTIVSSFPNLESFSLHQFQIQSLPAHIPNLPHLKKLSLEYMQLALTDVEKIINSCPSLEMLSCVALRSLNSTNEMLLTSPSLQHFAIKECMVNKIIVNNCPSIKTLNLSYLRNSDVLFSILGSCEHFSTIEVKKCDSAITESIVNAVITASKSKAVAHIPHFVKVKSLFSGSLEDVENEIFWSFHGHVALVRGPVHHHHHKSPELTYILRSIKDRTKFGVPYGSTMTSLLRAEPAVMMSENTLLRTNFPLAGPASNYDKCLVIITNEKDGRIL